MLSSDRPITTPPEDLYGHDPFARAIAAAVASCRDPEGLVFGLHGVWGSGKSRVVNLVRHHLKDREDARDLTVIDFNPWWCTDKDALAFSFFRELAAGIGPSVGEEAKGLVRKIGGTIGGLSRVIGAGMNLATLPGGALVEAAADWVSGAVEGDRTVAEVHRELSEKLTSSGQRFVVIIDDIDRLEAEEALLVFRLVKSAGRLPNVMYLLVYDHTFGRRTTVLSSRAHEDDTLSPQYLEKIVQVVFDLPAPDDIDLREALQASINQIMGARDGGDIERSINVFFDCVAPFIRRPRDVTRLSNLVRATWSSVAGEVDRDDFVALAVLQLFHPEVHAAVARNPDLVCGAQPNRHWQEDVAGGCEQRLLIGVSDSQRERVKRSLVRLFPALESAWGGLTHGDYARPEWRAERRACAHETFPAYFRFGIGDDTARRRDVDALIEASGDPEAVKALLLEALGRPRRRGGTMAAVMLDEILANAHRIAEDKIEPFMIGLFSTVDELMVAADEEDKYVRVDNRFRTHKIINRLIQDRLPVERRDVVCMAAAERAGLFWLGDFAERCMKQHKTPSGQSREREPILSRAATDRLVELAVTRFRDAATRGEIFGRHLVAALVDWMNLEGEGGSERVREYVAGQLADPCFVATLARSAVGRTRSNTVGSHATMEKPRLDRMAIEIFVDADSFLARVHGVIEHRDDGLDEDQRNDLLLFAKLWDAPLNEWGEHDLSVRGESRISALPPV